MIELTDYVSCVNLKEASRKFRATWRRHTNDRVFLASRLAECYARNITLRKCSRGLTRNYRRLEDYAKAVELVSTTERTGYGKLIEITIYVKYSSRKKKSWDREFEIRIYTCVPLYVSCATVTQFWEMLMYGSEADFIMSLVDAGGSTVVGGCRELLCPENEKWCNMVCRCDLQCETEIIVYDMLRGYEWEYSGPPWIEIT